MWYCCKLAEWQSRVLSFNLAAEVFFQMYGQEQQKSWGKKVFGYASHARIMREHRYKWGLRYHLVNVGGFCFVLSADTHISFSHPLWQAASCVCVSILSEQPFSSINHLITHSNILKMKMTRWIRLELATLVELANVEGPLGETAPGQATVAYYKNIIGPLWHFTVAPLCLLAPH